MRAESEVYCMQQSADSAKQEEQYNAEQDSSVECAAEQD